MLEKKTKFVSEKGIYLPTKVSKIKNEINLRTEHLKTPFVDALSKSVLLNVLEICEGRISSRSYINLLFTLIFSQTTGLVLVGILEITDFELGMKILNPLSSTKSYLLD